MSRAILVSLDLSGNEIMNAVAHLLAADPVAPAEGQFWYNTTDHVLRYRKNGSTVDVTPFVVDFGETGDIAASNFGDAGAAGATGEVADAGHVHPREANPVPAHEAAADPHAGYQKESEKGAANGYASLDGGGRVPASQMPVSAMEYKGTWNATTNTPALADGTGSTGDLYRVSTAGTQNLGSGAITFAVGDYVIYNGATWEKGDTTDAVSSIFGRTGAVVADAADYAGIYQRSVSADCVAALTTVVTHNFGHRHPTVTVRRKTAPYDKVDTGDEATTINTVTVRFSVAPAAGDFEITVLG